MFVEINECRICGNKNLKSIIDLGSMALTGIFPGSIDENIAKAPIELVKCHGEDGNVCDLVQLKHNYDMSLLYGANYGYRSGLNMSMVKHLTDKVGKIKDFVNPSQDDLIIDIGSNDSTLLRAYPDNFKNLVGIDPTGKKFFQYYPKHISLIPDFFSSKLVKDKFGDKKAKIITSIAMFYDLEHPIEFVKQIKDTLSDDGVWIFEQSYMPFMLKTTSYDTICHEHLEYYSLHQIKWIADKVGLKILDVEFNDVNGGSFSLMVTHKECDKYKENSDLIKKVLGDEQNMKLSTLEPYKQFSINVDKHKNDLIKFLDELKSKAKKVIGYGASTKGNVILQYCGIDKEIIPYIAEVNEDKFGKFTPGSLIPIISEKEAKNLKPDYFFVLPWHFKDNFLEREKEYIKSGGNLLFPLPEITVINQAK